MSDAPTIHVDYAHIPFPPDCPRSQPVSKRCLRYFYSRSVHSDTADSTNAVVAFEGFKDLLPTFVLFSQT
jgi:hypothetical protein